MPFDAPVTTAVLSDNLFMTFHPPNFPSSELSIHRCVGQSAQGDRRIVEEIDRWWMAVVSLWRTFTGTGAHSSVNSGTMRGPHLGHGEPEPSAYFSPWLRTAQTDCERLVASRPSRSRKA